MENDRVKIAGRGSARAAKHVFRTAEAARSSYSIRGEGWQKLFHLFRCKSHIIQEHSGMTGKDGYRDREIEI